ncbi:MAG: hypothetical protein QOD07_2034 [Frankiaceae bacterium]|jgi:hypothetical protein|nr:hypothetical protein [Frankiaceae bacterium]
MNAPWVSHHSELKAVDAFLAALLEPTARPDFATLQRRARDGTALVRVFRSEEKQDIVAGYVLYRLTERAVEGLLSGAVRSGRDLREDDFTRTDPAGYYISSAAALKGAARTMLTDLTKALARPQPVPVFARAATEAGRRTLIRNGFRALPTPSEVWVRPNP